MDIVTKFIEAMEGDLPPWRQPWSTNPSLPMNVRSHKVYSGVNTLTLLQQRHVSPYWGTLKSWRTMFSKQTPIFAVGQPELVQGVVQVPYRDRAGKPKVDQNGHALYQCVVRKWEVYNASQVRLLPLPTAVPSLIKSQRTRLATFQVAQPKEPDFGAAEELIAATSAEVCHGGETAIYDIHRDIISVPDKGCFTSLADYYETVFHELFHWCERGSRAGTVAGSSYGFRELVAEIGACLLMTHLQVPQAEKMIEQSARYVKEWLSKMRDDPQYLFDAANQASKVCKYLLAKKKCVLP